MRSWFKVFLKGMFMGAADIVPGVSGGTIALVTGIYERLILAINNLLDTILECIKSFGSKEHRKRLKEKAKKNDLRFLATLGTGGTISFLLISRIILEAIHAYPAYIFSFFGGLIIASAVMIYGHIRERNIGLAAAGIAGFAISIAVSSLNTLGSVHTLPVIFFSGFLGVCAMLLPGVSGSFVLLLLGQYEYMLSVLKNLVFAEIIVFVSGMAIGGLIMSKVIAYFLKKHEQKTISFLVGLMAGGVYLPVRNIMGVQGIFLNPVSVTLVIISGVAGLGMVFALEKLK